MHITSTKDRLTALLKFGLLALNRLPGSLGILRHLRLQIHQLRDLHADLSHKGWPVDSGQHDFGTRCGGREAEPQGAAHLCWRQCFQGKGLKLSTACSRDAHLRNGAPLKANARAASATAPGGQGIQIRIGRRVGGGTSKASTKRFGLISEVIRGAHGHAGLRQRRPS